MNIQRRYSAFILGVLLFCIGLQTFAQFNNEWIDFSKTYYKIKVGADGLYRIPSSVLQSNGLGTVRAEHVQLWRNGKQIPLYTSIPEGNFGASDFIEFYGQMNDGSVDAVLYRKPEFQLADKWSLQTDTAVYFLTVHTGSGNARMVNAANNTNSTSLPVDAYFMYTLGRYYRDQINPGFAALIGSFVYSSSYDNGEGWTSRNIQVSSPVVDQYKELFVAAAPVDARFRVTAFGNALNARKLQVSINANVLVDQSMLNFSSAIKEVVFPSSILGKATDTIRISNNTAVASDRMVVGEYELTYPRQFNFGAAGLFAFSLDAASSGNHLEITNFSNGGAAPILYDLSNGLRYLGDIAVAGKIRFVLPPGGKREFVLMNASSSGVRLIGSMAKKQFTDFGLPANQGNFLMISHSSLSSSSNGNALENYRLYRASPAGGSFQSKVYDIDELVDQFAFGIKKHPLSVKNFLRFARKKFTVPPRFALLIGKGVTYDQYRINEFRPIVERINLVPTFGNPGSDNILASDDNDPTPETAIGRLSVTSGDELNTYLNKVKQHDQALNSPNQTVKDKAWMKNIAHVIGGGEPYLQNIIDGYMNSARVIAEDSSFGAKVYTFNKISSAGIELVNSGALSNLFEEGLGLITYFGHSSANTMEFNLNDPAIFNNNGKYPIFLANGCNAGNFFIYDTLRATASRRTITESYTLIPQQGSIGFISSTHFGIVNYLNLYTNNFYKRFAQKDYKGGIGESQMNAIKDIVAIAGTEDFYNLITAEQILLGGDPAVKLLSYDQPDYAVEDPLVRIQPNPVSVTNPFFEIKAKYFNLARATSDSIRIAITHELPDGSTNLVYNKKILAPKYADSLGISVPIDPVKHKGENKIRVSLDPDGVLNEITKSNNNVVKSFPITEDEVRPVYPANFAIVNKAPIKLAASTSRFFQSPKQFQLEVDTTELFNSPIRVTQTQTSVGGAIEFTPSLPLKDSVVFYWRVAQKPDTGTVYKWSSASFLYLSKSASTGWNQSHYYQYLSNPNNDVTVSKQRRFEFSPQSGNIKVVSRLFPFGFTTLSNNLDIVFNSSCFSSINSLDFVIFKQSNGNPLVNSAPGGKTLYNSIKPTCNNPELKQFGYYYNNPTSRKYAMDFLDSVPRESIVVLNNWGSTTLNSAPEFIDKWKADTALYGSGKSIYHKLRGIGFTLIDSFYRNVPFTFIAYKDEQGSWQVLDQKIGSSASDVLNVNVNYQSRSSAGSYAHQVIGPAKTWESIHWDGFALENNSQDEIQYKIYGLGDGSGEKLLYSSTKKKLDTLLSFVNSKVYPYLKVVQEHSDLEDHTPWQSRYLQVKYKPFPEGALAATALQPFKDSVEMGESIQLSMAFKNISEVDFDSVKVFMSTTDPANVTTQLIDSLYKPLKPGDTIVVKWNFDTRTSVGQHSIYLNFNPDAHQPEQYLFNNYQLRNYYVNPDTYAPTLDVTFDGVHILNKDIVSSRPHILVKLKDDNRYLQLNDTSLLTLQLRYPDGSIKRIPFNSDTVQFTPASNAPGSDGNEATILYRPHLKMDGEYELIATGKDRSNNASGKIEYRVLFEVFNKSAITNLLNYPNPFTTSTAFVFTLTGSEIPTHFRIQILTITGKIVREINQHELGPIRIGNNITSFKWDGTDMFGQPVANGVYLYRVMADINGKAIDKLNRADYNTDRYFRSGYGKMYLMR